MTMIICDWLRVAFIFFLYGLAFFLLGFAILLYPKKRSSFKLADSLWLIAGFGILHGINEWLDMFILIGALGDSDVLEAIRMVTLPLSFFFLIQFASKVLSDRCEKYDSFKFLLPLLILIWMVPFLMGYRSDLAFDIWSRYSLCFPGALLSGFGCLLYIPEFREKGITHVSFHLKLAAMSLFCYSVLAGLIVPRGEFFPASILNYDMIKSSLGVPVQVLRAAAAIVMAYSIITFLRVFSWESREALRKSELRFQAVADNSAIIVFIEDKSCAITFIAGKGLAGLGFKADDLLGRSIWEVFPDSPEIRECQGRALEGESCSHSVVSNGLTFNVSYAPLRGDSGGIEGVVGVAADVSEIREAREKLDEYREEMARNRSQIALGAIGSTMAQQLEEPLSAVRIALFKALKGLKKTIGADEVKGNIGDGLREVNGAFETLHDFYAQANITPSPKAEPIDVQEMIERIIAVFGESSRRAMLRIVVGGTDIMPCMFISPKQLEQIFFILIQHSVEAEGGGQLRNLKINCRLDDGNMVVEFGGVCEGMDVKELNSVFESFPDAGAGSKTNLFGLAILGKLVKAYNGSIEVVSESAGQNKIIVTLPAEEAV